jgi:hypothetical protein
MIPGVRFNDIDDGSRIANAAGTSFNPLVDQVIAGVDRSGVLTGGAVYKDFTGVGGSIQMHAAEFRPQWLNRTLLFMGFDYPFNQLKVKKIFAPVPSFRWGVVQFSLHLGFKAEIIIPDVYPEGDLVLLSMIPEECRFLANPPRALVKD